MTIETLEKPQAAPHASALPRKASPALDAGEYGGAIREEVAESSPRKAARGSARVATRGEPAYLAEWHPLVRLAPLADEWRALADRALEPNVFYHPAFGLPAEIAFGHGVGAVLVWTDTAAPKLTGLFPARVANWRGGFALPVTLGWTHPYAPLGTPLVDRDHAAATIAAWLDCVAREPSLPDCVLLPVLPSEGPFASALASVLASRGASIDRFASHRRAMLAPGEDRDRYLDRALPSRKRKELSRQRRRLSGAGKIKMDVACEPADVAAALEVFMQLEQRGWKGRGGTAAMQAPSVRQFMQRAMAGLAARGQARIARLEAGGRCVAAGILLQSGSTGWFWKVAYDEDAARASPGVQLALDLTRAALDDATLLHVDSCATAGHPMIDHLWRERLPIADHLFAVDASSAARFALTRAAETLRRGVLDAARAMRNRLRR
jgi:hypothetical protein